MKKPDDSTLSKADLVVIEKLSKAALDKADAWGRFPTPIADIVVSADLQVLTSNAFDLDQVMEYVRQKSASTFNTIKSALSKVLGIYDSIDNVIHVDDSVGKSKQGFITLHEVGHHKIPAHRKLFSWFQDCEKTIAPQIADQFEREANNFARFALFQGDAFKIKAADMAMGIKTPMGLATHFGASVYASAREFARTHHEACVVYALNPVQFDPVIGMHASVRRIEPSPKFKNEFGEPSCEIIDKQHHLLALLPVGGKKMKPPTTLILTDKNGTRHECLGEAFKTPYNIFVLIYPIKALTASSIILPNKFTMET